MKSTTTEISVRPQERHDFIDVTDELRRAIKDSGVVDGCAVAFCTHTTCALVINEWENGAQEDLRKRPDELVPEGIYYAHDDLERRSENLQEEERKNGRAHVMQMLMGGSSHAIPVKGSEPLFGRWQRLFLVELDGSKDRKILFHVFGE